MKTLIIKLGATGDVVRTTTLLHILRGEVLWLTADHNAGLLSDLPGIEQCKCIPWSRRQEIHGISFDLVINLEDSLDTGEILNEITFGKVFGAYINTDGALTYTADSSQWFDISLISKYGKARADELKLENRQTYQKMIFQGIGRKFCGEPYLLPDTNKGELSGDIAVAPKSGSVWPMKNWAYFEDLVKKLRNDGYAVNYLPNRDTILEHIADIRNHKYLISGDSLPMHIAMGSGIKCLTIFICTSPWEIYDYGLQKKIVSPNLNKYFYRRDFDPEAVTSISLDEVYETVISHMGERD